MADLAIGVVDQVVEEDEPLHLEVLAAPKLLTVGSIALRLDVKLHTADTLWSISNHRRWDEVPSYPATKEIGCQLASIERAVWKVVERRFAGPWLVDCQLAAPIVSF